MHFSQRLSPIASSPPQNIVIRRRKSGEVYLDVLESDRLPVAVFGWAGNMTWIWATVFI
jgi:hypothetical protein